ncbi:MAG: hypothetical protein ABF277_05450 [Candidatus Arcticimaribacter sp.]
MKFPKLLLLIGALLCTSISSKVWSQLNYLETSQGDNNFISLCIEESLTVTATAIGGSNSGFVFNRIRGGITQTIQFNSPDGDIVLYPLSAGESSNETYMDGDIFYAEIFDYTNAGTIALSPYISDQFTFNALGLNLGLKVENFDFGFQYNFPFQKESKVFAPSIFELYLVFDFSPFRRNQRGYLKRLQINNY